jgi:hypothetical protein
LIEKLFYRLEKTIKAGSKNCRLLFYPAIAKVLLDTRGTFNSIRDLIILQQAGNDAGQRQRTAVE